MYWEKEYGVLRTLRSGKRMQGDDHSIPARKSNLAGLGSFFFFRKRHTHTHYTHTHKKKKLDRR
jgi:hypothetical protein